MVQLPSPGSPGAVQVLFHRLPPPWFGSPLPGFSPTFQVPILALPQRVPAQPSLPQASGGPTPSRPRAPRRVEALTARRRPGAPGRGGRWRGGWRLAAAAGRAVARLPPPSPRAPAESFDHIRTSAPGGAGGAGSALAPAPLASGSLLPGPRLGAHRRPFVSPTLLFPQRPGRTGLTRASPLCPLQGEFQRQGPPDGSLWHPGPGSGAVAGVSWCRDPRLCSLLEGMDEPLRLGKKGSVRPGRICMFGFSPPYPADDFSSRNGPNR
jgi:hypothetical protein